MRRKLVLFVAVVLGGVGFLSLGADSAGAQAGDGVVPITPCVVLDTTQAVGGFSGPLFGGAEVDAQVVGNIPAAQGGATNCGVPGGASGVVVDVTALSPLRPGNLRAFPTGIPSTGGVVNFSPQTPALDNSNAVIVPLSVLGQLTIAVNAGGSTLETVDVRLTVIGYLDPAGLQYHPVTPCAAFDSRPSQGSGGVWDGPFVGSESRTIDVTGLFTIVQGGGEGNCDVPNGADAVFVNLVGINAVGEGRFGLRAAGDTDTTTYTSYAGLTPTMNNSNAVIVPVDQLGQLDVFSVADAGSQANARVVVLGYFTDNGDPFVALSPCAAFDSRSNQGATGDLVGPFDGDEIVEYQIAGPLPAAQGGGGNDCGVPVGASAVLMNLVAVGPERGGNLRVNAVGTVPSGGVVNFAALAPAMNNSNAIAIPLSLDGRLEVGVNVGSAGAGQPAAHVRGVVLGYYLDEDRELGVDITTPEEGPIADRPTTFVGAATDDVGVISVELEITDQVTGLVLGLCGIDVYCWLPFDQTLPLETDLDAPGAIGTGFSLGPIDLDAGGSGSYRVEATVFDGDGNQVTDEVAFRTMPISPPTVELVAPADGATVASEARLYVTATDDQGINSVSVVLQDVNSGVYLQQFGDGSQSWIAQAPVSIPLGQFPGTESWTNSIRAQGSDGRIVRVVSVTAGDGGGSSNTIDPGVTFTIGDDDVAVDPTVAVTVPTSNQLLPLTSDIQGTAFDGSGVDDVEVLIQDANLGVYWNGVSYSSSPVWLPADKGGEVVADVDWLWPIPASIQDDFGSQNFYVTARATDVDGNEASSAQVLFSVGVDNQPPTVSLTTPPDGLIGSGPALFAGSASDNTGVAAVTVSVFDPTTGDYWAEPGWVDTEMRLDAELANPNGPATGWTLDLFDPNDGSGSGNYTVTVRAVDLAGLETTATSTVVVDETPPVVVLTEPADDDEILDASFVKFVAEASDDADIDTVEFEIRDRSGPTTRWWNGATWVTSSARVEGSISDTNANGVEFSFTGALPGTSGEHDVRAFATDEFGNEGASIRVDFFVDSAAPTVAFSGSTTDLTSPFQIAVNADDDIGIDRVEVQIEDVATELFFNGTSFVATPVWIDVPNLSSIEVDPDGPGGSGSYTVIARVTDEVGKVGTATTTYGTADNQVPVAAITAPTGGQVVDAPTAIVGTATDNRPVVSVEIEVRETACGSRYYNGTSFQNGATPFAAVIDSGSGTGSVTWTAAISLDAAGGCGSYRARVRAFDAAGNSQYSSLVFFDTDTENPTVSIDQPTGPTTTAPFNLFITSTDDNPGVEIFYTIQDSGSGLYWDGDDFVAGEVELLYTGLTEVFSKGDVGTGDYKITAIAVDVVGNRSPSDALLIQVVP